MSIEEPSFSPDPEELKISEVLRPKYLLLPTGNPRDFAIPIQNRPTLLLRCMHKLFFGFKYIPIEQTHKF
jgi:hypothetical protein